MIGITISKEQYEHARTTDLEPEELEFLRIPSLNSKGMGKFEFRFQDYRDIDEVSSIKKIMFFNVCNYYFKILIDL